MSPEPSQKAAQPPAPSWPLAWPLLCATSLFLLFFLLFAHPVSDGDPYWQMAYARYFLENSTLIPDHGAFSWSPYIAGDIYCAWIGQFLLYGIYEVFGLAGFFILRYLCISAFLAVSLYFLRAFRLFRNPAAWAMILIGLMASSMAESIKPQLLSYTFICLVAGLWMHLKLAPEKSRFRVYLFPLFAALWVNSHGGYLVGIAFMGAIGAGEMANAIFSKKDALPKSLRHSLYAALALCPLTVVATPYGLAYPLALVRQYAKTDNSLHFQTVAAYATIFEQSGKYLFIPILFVGAGILAFLAVLQIRRKRFDWAVALVNGLGIFLYLKYSRTTFFWAPFFTLSALWWMREAPPFFAGSKRVRFLLGAAISLACIFLTARTAYTLATNPATNNWLGFGVSYANPVEEARFIRNHLPGVRLGNDYNSGGYLLWELAPKTPVMIDQRHFPFRAWAKEYLDFHHGEKVPEFLMRFRTDAWCLSLNLQKTLAWLNRSDEWKPAFYGPSTAVFVKSDREIPPEAPFRAAGLTRMKNLTNAYAALAFAVSIQDMKGAQQILNGMTERFDVLEEQRDFVSGCRTFMEGLAAYYAHQWDPAVQKLLAARKQKVMYSNRTLFDALIQKSQAHWDRGETLEAKQAADLALALEPASLLAVYNQAAILYALTRVAGGSSSGSYEPGLRAFLSTTEGMEERFSRERDEAQKMLSGALKSRPVLLALPLPERPPKSRFRD